jgi:hypothetical protein
MCPSSEAACGKWASDCGGPLQQALLQVLESKYDASFSPFSYGLSPAKSAHKALTQARPHDVLMSRLTKATRRVLRLTRRTWKPVCS